MVNSDFDAVIISSLDIYDGNVTLTNVYVNIDEIKIMQSDSNFTIEFLAIYHFNDTNKTIIKTDVLTETSTTNHFTSTTNMFSTAKTILETYLTGLSLIYTDA